MDKYQQHRSLHGAVEHCDFFRLAKGWLRFKGGELFAHLWPRKQLLDLIRRTDRGYRQEKSQTR